MPCIHGEMDHIFDGLVVVVIFVLMDFLSGFFVCFCSMIMCAFFPEMQESA